MSRVVANAVEKCCKFEDSWMLGLKTQLSSHTDFKEQCFGLRNHAAGAYGSVQTAGSRQSLPTATRPDCRKWGSVRWHVATHAPPTGLQDVPHRKGMICTSRMQAHAEERLLQRSFSTINGDAAFKPSPARSARVVWTPADTHNNLHCLHCCRFPFPSGLTGQCWLAVPRSCYPCNACL